MPTLLTANAYIMGSRAARSKGGNAGNVLNPQETLMTRMWFCGEGNVQPCNLTAQELLGVRGQAHNELRYPLLWSNESPQAPITGKPCGAWGAQGGSSTFYVLRRMKDYG